MMGSGIIIATSLLENIVVKPCKGQMNPGNSFYIEPWMITKQKSKCHFCGAYVCCWPNYDLAMLQFSARHSSSTTHTFSKEWNRILQCSNCLVWKMFLGSVDAWFLRRLLLICPIVDCKVGKNNDTADTDLTILPKAKWKTLCQGQWEQQWQAT